MSKDLIIVESPAKVKTIKRFLGGSYLVDASVGHVRDLPKKELGVDEEHGYEPKYQVIPGKKKVVTRLRKEAEQADNIYLAPDPDREGEAIAWHVAELIKDKNPNIHRIQFNEITARAVKQALKQPRKLDESLFNSQQARRILDRLVGYKISPLLWKKVKRGLSAGRVQSVALRLIVDRERERHAFVPQEYWVLKVMLEGDTPPPFSAELWKWKGKKAKIANSKQAGEVESEAKASSFEVADIQEKEVKRQPKPPYITSTLQQDANARFNFSAKQTMSLAQKLYEGLELGDKGITALITYMRTDSFRVANEARDAAKEWVLSNLGKEYYPKKERVYRSKGSAQDAHEAIRPVDVHLTPDSVKPFLDARLHKLYDLIWKRFVASQMAPARVWDTKVEIASGKALWRAKGERLIFPGYLSVYGGVKEEEDRLPKLEKGQKVQLINLEKEQKFTQPPARFTEASLVRKMEEKGIGRPSTYASIISTIVDRDYVQLIDRHFIPTELGTTVSDLLVGNFPKLLDIGFTADMESGLDKIAEGNKEHSELLREFMDRFNSTLEKAQQNMAAVKTGVETDIFCEKCKEQMVIKFGRHGAFLACSAYPECKNTKNFKRDEQGNIVMLEEEEREAEVVGQCPDCKEGNLIIKKARTGSRFIACSRYPKCKHSEPFSTGVACPREECEGMMVEKSSRRGKVFYACNQYPKCDFAVWDWPVPEECPKCDSKILVRKYTKTRGDHLACPSKGCKYFRTLDEE